MVSTLKALRSKFFDLNEYLSKDSSKLARDRSSKCSFFSRERFSVEL